MEDEDGDPGADGREPDREPDVADEALNAMSKAVASLRDQAARMITPVPPLDAEPPERPDPPAEDPSV